METMGVICRRFWLDYDAGLVHIKRLSETT